MALLYRRLKSRQVNLPEGPLGNMLVDALTQRLLIVRREMLHIRNHALILDPLRELGRHAAAQTGILGKGLEDTAISRVSVNIGVRRTEQHIDAVGDGLPCHCLAHLVNNLRLPGSSQKHTRRETSRLLPLRADTVDQGAQALDHLSLLRCHILRQRFVVGGISHQSHKGGSALVVGDVILRLLSGRLFLLRRRFFRCLFALNRHFQAHQFSHILHQVDAGCSIQIPYRRNPIFWHLLGGEKGFPHQKIHLLLHAHLLQQSRNRRLIDKFAHV